MLENRSVPPDTVLPHVVYRDVSEAIAWLTKTFGFREHYRYGDPGGPISGAQVHLGNAWIMLERARPGSLSPVQLGYGTQSLTVFVDDVEAHFHKPKRLVPRSSRSSTSPCMANASMELKTPMATTGSFLSMLAT
jgi:hypothetical protein